MRSIGYVVALLALVACGGGGAGAGTNTGGGGNPPPTTCSLDSDCGGVPAVCEAGACTQLRNDDTSTPYIVDYGPHQLDAVGVHQPLWFTFSKVMRIAPGGFPFVDQSTWAAYQATPELSVDRKTLTFRTSGVVAPSTVQLGLRNATDLSGRSSNSVSMDVHYRSWWPLTEQLTRPTSTSGDDPSIAVDGSGNILATWGWYDAANVHQLYTKRWDGNSWTDLGILNLDAKLDAYTSRLAARGSFVASAFLQEAATGWQVVVRTWTVAGGWSAPLGGTVGGSDLVGDPALALDGAGHPVVAFTVPGGTGQGRQLLVRRWDGATWSAVGTGALNQSAAHDALAQKIAIDPNDRPVVTFLETIAFGDYDLNVKRWDGGAWALAGAMAPAVHLARDSTSDNTLAVLPDGRIAAGWLDDARVFHVRLLEATGWGADEQVESVFQVHAPALVVGPDGLWGGYGSNGGCNAALRTDLGWVKIGMINPLYSDFFQCSEGRFAAGPTLGPVILFGNTNPMATWDDLGVFAVNR